jgi:hypothetical protein
MIYLEMVHSLKEDNMSQCVLDIYRYRKIKTIVIMVWLQTGSYLEVQKAVQNQFHVTPSLFDMCLILSELEIE